MKRRKVILIASVVLLVGILLIIEGFVGPLIIKVVNISYRYCLSDKHAEP